MRTIVVASAAICPSSFEEAQAQPALHFAINVELHVLSASVTDAPETAAALAPYVSPWGLAERSTVKVLPSVDFPVTSMYSDPTLIYSLTSSSAMAALRVTVLVAWSIAAARADVLSALSAIAPSVHKLSAVTK